jgi:hypothetical protein
MSSASLGDLSSQLNFGGLLSDLNTLFPGATTELTSLLGADLPTLAGLFANPLDFLSF